MGSVLSRGLPYAAAGAAVLAAALWLQQWLGAQLGALDGLAASDPDAAQRGAEVLLRAAFRSVAAFALGAAVLFAHGGQLALRERRIPPRGLWSLWGPRLVTGPAARRHAIAVLVLAACLAAASVATLALGGRLVSSWAAAATRAG
jgi:hypothetical protein